MEVESCDVLIKVLEGFFILIKKKNELKKKNKEMGNNHGYVPYLLKGTDTATGQNVGILTRIDPISNLQR